MSSRKEPVRDAAELLRNLLTPLCGALRSARQGDMLRLQVEAQNLSVILDVLGYIKEAKKVEEAML